jgi:sirohydrochlorin ferrochelatase
MTQAVLLIAHGSRNPRANEDLHAVAGILRERGHNLVVASFLELAEPGIVEGGRMCVREGASRVVLLPYFLSAGVHVQRDLTEARDTLAAEFPEVPFVLAGPLGPHPALITIVQERIAEVEGLTGR